MRVALEQKDARLVPDMGVRVSFLAAEGAGRGARPPQGVLVPAAAIVQRDGHAVVFVVVDGKARLRAVTPARRTSARCKPIPAGVSAGDRVVLSPPADAAGRRGADQGRTDERPLTAQPAGARAR